MSYSNGYISKDDPVSIHDIQQALGTGLTDLGTIIEQANINKWSKVKPVKLSKLFCNLLEDNNYQADGNCGFEGIVASADGAINATNINNTLNNNNMPVYARPAGGVSTPFRITDFRGYSASALAPIAKRQDFIFNGLLTDLMEIPIDSPAGFQVSRDLRLDLTDISTWANCYFLFCLFNGSTMYFKCSNETLAQSIAPETSANYTFNLSSVELNTILTPGQSYQTALLLMHTNLTGSNLPTSLTTASAASGFSFYNLPYDARADALCNLKYRFELNWSWSYQGMCNSASSAPSSSLTWTIGNSFATYPPYDSETGDYSREDQYYYNLGTSLTNYLFIKFNISNTGTYAFDVYVDNIEAQCGDNFATGLPGAGQQPITVYDSSFNLMSGTSLTTHNNILHLGVGETKTIILRMPEGMLWSYKNGSGVVEYLSNAAPNQHVISTFIFKYKNQNIGQQSKTLCFRNSSAN